MSSFHIARNGQQLGVFPESEIQSGIASGRFLADDLFWAEGMPEWQSLSTQFVAQASAPVFAAAASSAASFNPYAAPQAAIITTAMMPQLNLASRWVRLGAAFLDTFIMLVVMILPMIPAFVLLSQAEKGGKVGNDFPVYALYWFGAAALAVLGLLVWNAIWLAKHGQTIAKRMCGIRIVSYPSGEPAGAAKAFWLRGVVNYIINSVVPLYGIVDVCFIFREDKRCVHDLISETTVVVVETVK